MKAQEIIELYGLQKHPEGGYFRETYRADGKMVAAEPGGALAGPRNFSTAIFFLLTKGDRSRLHRIKSDEVWHFYRGGPLTVAEIRPDGTVRKTVLGPDIKAGQKLQHVVPAGSWFGAWPEEGTEYALVGCTVAPGFDFSDFELGERSELLKRFPRSKDIIERLA
jgi:hypothetical protein